MYNNISKSLLAVASLAMMTAAKITVITDGAHLHRMSETGEKFVMSKEDTLSIKI